MKHGHHAATHVGPSASHGRPATIRDLPPHLLAARVAAHLSAADAARLMQAAGHDHHDELKHVMDTKKKEAEEKMVEKMKETVARIVDMMKKALRPAPLPLIDLKLYDGRTIRVGGYKTTRYRWHVDIQTKGKPGNTRLDYGYISHARVNDPNVAEIFTIRTQDDIASERTSTPREFRTLLMEVARQYTGKRIVAVGSKNAGYEREQNVRTDPGPAFAYVSHKILENPGALIVWSG